ncbi:MAG: hypothetical protein U0871_25075 [Gemmataceae bacterium]
MRFELNPGSPVEPVLEPWEARVVLHDQPYPGDVAETVRARAGTGCCHSPAAAAS